MFYFSVETVGIRCWWNANGHFFAIAESLGASKSVGLRARGAKKSQKKACLKKNSTTRPTFATAANTRHSAAAATRARRRSIAPSSKREKGRERLTARGAANASLSVTGERKEKSDRRRRAGVEEESKKRLNKSEFHFLPPFRFVRPLSLAPSFSFSVFFFRKLSRARWTRAPRSPSRRSRWSP